MTTLTQKRVRSETLWHRRSHLQRATSTLLPLLRRPGFSLAVAVVVFSLVAALAPHLLSSFDPYATAPLAKLDGAQLDPLVRHR